MNQSKTYHLIGFVILFTGVLCGSMFSKHGIYSFFIACLLIFLGAMVGKKGTELYNIENGLNSDQIERTKKSNFDNARMTQAIIILLTIILLLRNYYN